MTGECVWIRTVPSVEHLEAVTSGENTRRRQPHNAGRFGSSRAALAQPAQVGQ